MSPTTVMSALICMLSMSHRIHASRPQHPLALHGAASSTVHQRRSVLLTVIARSDVQVFHTAMRARGRALCRVHKHVTTTEIRFTARRQTAVLQLQVATLIAQDMASLLSSSINVSYQVRQLARATLVKSFVRWTVAVYLQTTAASAVSRPRGGLHLHSPAIQVLSLDRPQQRHLLQARHLTGRRLALSTMCMMAPWRRWMMSCAVMHL